MARILLVLTAAAVLTPATSVLGQDREDPPPGWTRPDTVHLEGAGAFAHPELIPGPSALYIAAHTALHPQLLGNPSAVGGAKRYRSSKSLWLGRVANPSFTEVETIGPPQGYSGHFRYLYPEGKSGPGGTVHLAWAEANPDSIAARKDLTDRVNANRVYYARFSGQSWSPPEKIYQSEGTEGLWGGVSYVNWGRDQEGVLRLGSAGSPHLAINHFPRGSMVYLRRRARDDWQADTVRYAPEAQPRGPNRDMPLGGSRDLAVGEEGRLALAYSAVRTEEGLQSNEVRVARSSDGGRTWKRSTVLSPGQRIDNEEGQGSVRHLELAGRPGDTLHVVWGRKTANLTFSAQELWHAWSADGGETWTTTSPIDLPSSGHFDDLEVVTGPGGTLYAFAHLGGLKDNDASTADLHYARWHSGKGWTKLHALTPASKHVVDAGVAAWRGRLHLVWSQTPLPFDYSTPVTILRRSRPLPSKPTPK